MNNDELNQPTQPDAIDDAIAQRLSRLRTRPVDLSRLEQSIAAQIPKPVQHTTIWRIRHSRPVQSLAALLMVALTLAIFVLASSSGPALASPAALLQLHQNVISHTDTASNVSSMEAANHALAGHWPDAPALPDVPDQNVMSCCVQTIGRAKAACALLSVDGQQVTMAAADAADVKLPDGAPVNYNGTSFQVQSSGDVNMVMTERNGKWYCMIGKLPSERLMEFWRTVAK